MKSNGKELIVIIFKKMYISFCQNFKVKIALNWNNEIDLQNYSNKVI